MTTDLKADHRPGTRRDRWARHGVPLGVPTLAWATAAWAIGYGSLNAWWALGHAPALPVSPMVPGLQGWVTVGLCGATLAMVLALSMRALPRMAQWVAVGVGCITASGLTLGGAGLVLDVLRILPGGPTGVGSLPFSATAFAGRVGCLVGAVLIARMVLRAQRRLRGACRRCGRIRSAVDPGVAPRWAMVAGYLTVLACIARILAEAITWKLPATPANVGSLVLFAVGMALAGSLLPLALVHRWGLIWPRWVLPVAGRRVPRWLVLGPALFVSAGLVFIFGPELTAMMAHPPSSFGQFGVLFLWAAMASYTIWGLALGVAAVSYFHRSRPGCRLCGATASFSSEHRGADIRR